MTKSDFGLQVGEWGEWKFVTKKNGAVIKQRRRMIKVDPENGGKKCPSLKEVLTGVPKVNLQMYISNRLLELPTIFSSCLFFMKYPFFVCLAK